MRDRITEMEFVTKILQKFWGKKTNKKTLAQYKAELLSNQGREQFKLLMKRGLGVPVKAM